MDIKVGDYIHRRLELTLNKVTALVPTDKYFQVYGVDTNGNSHSFRDWEVLRVDDPVHYILRLYLLRQAADIVATNRWPDVASTLKRWLGGELSLEQYLRER